MKGYHQLSMAQKRVVDLLRQDREAYCRADIYYDFQRIILPNKKELNTYFCRPTLRALIKYKTLILTKVGDELRYILNITYL